MSGLPIQVAYSEQVARFIAIALVAAACWPIQSSHAQSGAASPLQLPLARKVSLTWEASPLKQGLERLSTSQGIAIFLDRRIDPGLPVTIEVDQTELLHALRRIASEYRLGVGFVGPVVYVGPPRAAVRLATLAELRQQESRVYPEELRAALLTKQPLRWNRLSEPRWLIRQLCAEAALVATNLEQIPHDVWPEVNLPPMSWHERFTLLLANFGMTYRIDAEQREVTIVPIPRAVAIERSYPLGDAAESMFADLEARFPQAIWQREGKRARVRCTVEDHWAIRAYLADLKKDARRPALPATRQRGRVGDPVQRHSLKVNNQPFGPVAEQLGKRLNVQVEFGPNAQAKQQQLVEFSVTNASLDELMHALAAAADLQATLTDDRVLFD